MECRDEMEYVVVFCGHLWCVHNLIRTYVGIRCVLLTCKGCGTRYTVHGTILAHLQKIETTKE